MCTAKSAQFFFRHGRAAAQRRDPAIHLVAKEMDVRVMAAHDERVEARPS
jgi:hypothetical protein